MRGYSSGGDVFPFWWNPDTGQVEAKGLSEFELSEVNFPRRVGGTESCATIMWEGKELPQDLSTVVEAPTGWHLLSPLDLTEDGLLKVLARRPGDNKLCVLLLNFKDSEAEEK